METGWKPLPLVPDINSHGGHAVLGLEEWDTPGDRSPSSARREHESKLSKLTALGVNEMKIKNKSDGQSGQGLTSSRTVTGLLAAPLARAQAALQGATVTCPLATNAEATGLATPFISK